MDQKLNLNITLGEISSLGVPAITNYNQIRAHKSEIQNNGSDMVD